MRGVEHGLGHDFFSDGDFKMTTAAAKQIGARITRDGVKYRSNFTLNPTTGALELPVHQRLKLENALRAEARRLQLRLYFRLPGLYLRKLALQARYTALNLARDLACNLSDLALNRHRPPPC
jgi:hypothetical protein